MSKLPASEVRKGIESGAIAALDEGVSMGMTVGGAKGVAAEPNIVPLIDVLLVLIIIFMVMPSSKGLPTLVPQPAPPDARDEPKTIVVQVLPGGKLLINRDPSDWDTLGARVSEIFKDRADKVAFVKGDTDVPFDQVARAIDIMRGAGIEHVGLLTAGMESAR